MLYPRIENWELYFEREFGKENRRSIVEAFVKYWETFQGELVINGKCVLGGNVFGREGFKDGAEVFTSYIKSIKRVEGEDECDLMCAETESGTKYYFDAGEYNSYMGIMIADMINHGDLNDQQNYYLRPKYWDSTLL